MTRCGECSALIPDDLIVEHLAEHGLGTNLELAEAIRDATNALREDDSDG